MHPVKLGLIAALAASLSSWSADAADYTIKVAHAVPPSAPIHRAFLAFKEAVEKKSGGRIEVRVFHSGQLGGQRESVEATQAGAVEIAAMPNGVIASFAPDFQLMDIPFQFGSLKQARSFLDETGEKLLFPSLPAVQLVGLAMWEQGYRNIGSIKRELVSADDMKNLHLRTMEAPLHITAWRALGANPTPLGWGQVYTAMQQGLIEAVENPSYIFTQSKISENIRHFTVSQHIYDPIIVVGSKTFFDKLPADLSALVHDELQALTPSERAMAEEEVVKAEDQMEKAGIKIRRLTAEERAALARLAQPAVLDALRLSVGEEKLSKWRAAVAALPPAQ